MRLFPGGTCLVELAEVSDPVAVPSAALAALDLHDQADAVPLPLLLLSCLRDAELLLVLDNCEHLLSAADAFIDAVLRAAPGDFELTTANQGAVTELCRRLDGLPLAIELAAVRTRVLSVEQILARLSDRFTLLAAGNGAARPRHQALRTTIDWSYDLLSEDERALLRRCCVFAGRFTLDDVEGVCAGGQVPAGQVLDLLTALVSKSLLIRESRPGPAWYRLHETMREFARLKLAEAGEEEATWRRCAGYYLAARRRTGVDRRYQLPQWLAWVQDEIDNLRAVLWHCLQGGDTASGLGLAATLGWYWATRATSEGLRWLSQFTAAGADPQLLAWAGFWRGFLAVLKADPVTAVPFLESAMTAARRAGDQAALYEALAMASAARSMTGEHAQAARLLAEAETVIAGLDYPPGRLSAVQARVFSGFFSGDLDLVTAAAAEGVTLARAAGDHYALEMMLLNLGSAALLARDPDQARPLLSEALNLAEQIDDRVAQFYLLAALGCAAALSGRPRDAARLIGAAEAAQAQAGLGVVLFLGATLDTARQAAGAALGAASLTAEVAAGRALSRDAALAPALGRPAAPASPQEPETGTDPLSPREAEVARLVADGLTNRQIGRKLLISERTVDSHVRAILGKLGAGSRAQVAAWAAAAQR